MAEVPPELEYLREPRFIGFSVEMFGSAIRLPIWGAILELTPVPEEDLVYTRQIAAVLDTDPGNTIREIQRTERMRMIERHLSQGTGQARRKNTANYARVLSPRWSIVEIAIKSAKEELGL